MISRTAHCINTALIFALVGVLSASTLHAQELTFEEAIGQAKTAYDAGDFDKAVNLLITANRLQPDSRLLLNIARSYAKADDCVKAVAYFQAFMRAPDADQKLVKTVKRESDALKCTAYDANASGRVMINSVPPGANVSVDGKDIGKTPLETVSLAEGERTFTFVLEGYEPVARQMTMGPEEDATLAVSLKEVVVVVEPEVEEVEEIKLPPPPKDYTQHYIAGGVAGVGVGLLVMGLVYDTVLIPDTDEERKTVEWGSARYNELTDQRSSQATMALVGYVGGGILFAGGAGYLTYLLLTDSDDEAATVHLMPAVGQDTVGFGLFGTF